ncbi:MAG: TRAP-T-associated universal stress protein TeaD [Anaerolineales bacterium]|nr:TRAP-T-associated universal stress protein TeaD [Anaerolineales bacterium]
MFERILVAVDGSRYSRYAAEAAVDLAERYQASVWIVHAIRDFSLPEEILQMMRAGEITESRREILEDSAEIILETAAKHFEEAGYSDVQTEFVYGDPATTIAKYAEDHDADLIVVGYRGLQGEGDFLGGVARKLLHATSISCLVVRGEGRTQK